MELPSHEKQINTNRSTTKIMKLFAICFENSTVYGFKMFSKHQDFVQKQTNTETQKFQKTTTVAISFLHIYQSIECLSTVTFVQTDLCANATLKEITQQILQTLKR